MLELVTSGAVRSMESPPVLIVSNCEQRVAGLKCHSSTGSSIGSLGQNLRVDEAAEGKSWNGRVDELIERILAKGRRAYRGRGQTDSHGFHRERQYIVHA